MHMLQLNSSIQRVDSAAVAASTPAYQASSMAERSLVDYSGAAEDSLASTSGRVPLAFLQNGAVSVADVSLELEAERVKHKQRCGIVVVFADPAPVSSLAWEHDSLFPYPTPGVNGSKQYYVATHFALFVRNNSVDVL